MYSTKDIKILTLLVQLDRVNQFKPIGVKAIIRNLEKINFPISESTVRRSLIKLIENNYVAYGVKKEQEKKYYITKEGSDFMSSTKMGGNLDE